GLAFDEPLPAEWVDEQLSGVGRGATAIHAIKEAPGAAKLEVDPLAPVATRPPIRIHGSIKASLETTCVRCLEPLRQAVEPAGDLTLFAAGGPTANPSQRALDEEGLSKSELDDGTYEKNE